MSLVASTKLPQASCFGLGPPTCPKSPGSPTDLPDGTEIELLPLDPGDWLDEADGAALHEALRQSDADVAAGRLVDAEEILKELRSR